MMSLDEPTATQTSTSLRIASTKASEEKGRTMPEVPMMEMPATIPILGLKVRGASSFPPGTEMVVSGPFCAKSFHAGTEWVISSPLS